MATNKIHKGLFKAKNALVQSSRRAWLGKNAPKRGELIYVPTSEVKSFIIGANVPRKEAGYISDENWESRIAPLYVFPKFRSCVDHWKHGVPWACTEAYIWMISQIRKKGIEDGCRNIKDVVDRHHGFGEIFEQASHEGRLRCPASTSSNAHLFRKHSSF